MIVIFQLGPFSVTQPSLKIHGSTVRFFPTAGSARPSARRMLASYTYWITTIVTYLLLKDTAVQNPVHWAPSPWYLPSLNTQYFQNPSTHACQTYLIPNSSEIRYLVSQNPIWPYLWKGVLSQNFNRQLTYASMKDEMWFDDGMKQ